MKRCLCVIALTTISAMAIADPKVVYVGDGRFACQGSARECEPIHRRNEEREFQRKHLQEVEKQTDELRRLNRRTEDQAYGLEKKQRYRD